MNNLSQNLLDVYYRNGDYCLYDVVTKQFSYSNFWTLRNKLYAEFANSSEQSELLSSYNEFLQLTLREPADLAFHFAVLSSLSDCVDGIDLVLDTNIINISKLGSTRLLDYSNTSVAHLKETLSLFTVLDGELQLRSTEKYVFPFSEGTSSYEANSKFLNWILSAYPEILKMVKLSQDIGVIDANMMNFDDLMLYVIDVIDSQTRSYALTDIDIVYE